MTTKQTDWTVAKHGVRIEIKMEGSSIALSDSLENEALASKIVRAVNEHAALCAVAQAAANLAHECVPNSDKNMPRLRELWTAQANLASVRNS